MRVVLVADGGSMTVGRQTSTYTYGVFQVDIPEDRQQVQQDDRLQEGYIYRPDGRPSGRFDISFVRADAQVDVNAGQSNLESIIDSAQSRTEGNVFFERDISGRGLGRFAPGVDYDTGSQVDVLIWGKTLRLPVTSIDMVGGTDTPLGWRVHVGGQLISDAESLRSHNAAIEGQIEQERRRRLATTQTANAAAAAADAADEKAVAAREVADETARALAQENRQRILENEAFTAALNAYYEATRPQTGFLETNGRITYRSCRFEKTNRTISLTALNTDDVGYVGVTAIGSVRVNALSQYSEFFELEVTKENPSKEWKILATEEIVTAAVTVHPNFRFSAILTNERKKRGLV